MNGKSTAVALLGLGLLGAHYKTNPDGSTLKNAISNANGGPSPEAAHKAFMRFFGLLLGVVVATIIAQTSDSAGAVMVAFFVFLWVIWGMTNLNKLGITNISNFYTIRS